MRHAHPGMNLVAWTRRALASLIVAALAMTKGTAVRGDIPPEPPAAALHFRVLGTGQAGTFQIGGVTQPMAKGESSNWHIEVRMTPPSAGERCGGTQVTVGPSALGFDGPRAPLLAWDVTGSLREAETERIVAGYAWTRSMRGSGGGVEQASGGDEATLREDGRVLLDFVTVSRDADPAGCYRNFALELEVSLADEKALTDRALGYDLWLMQEGRHGRATRRVQLIGKHGEKVAFDFGAVRLGSPNDAPATGVQSLQAAVSGQLRGRRQPDGTLEIALAAQMELGNVERTWIAGAHGEKVFRATPGEVLRLELPPPGNLDGLKGDQDALAAVRHQQLSLVLTPSALP
jgi:hypothetical protein